jgi:hypothetical protein
MVRAQVLKIILASVLSGLWFVIGANLTDAQAYLCLLPGSSPLIAPGEQCEKDSTHSEYSFDQAARRWNRRLDDLSRAGKETGGTQPAASTITDPLATATEIPRRVSADALYLAVSWQFSSLAATQPRAPSTVS